MSEKTRKNHGIIVFSAVIVGFLVLFGVLNIKLLEKTVAEKQKNELTFEEFVDDVQESYTSDFFLKNQFINLNGFFARITGHRQHNEVNLMSNGMLLGNYGRCNIEPIAQNVTKFNEYVHSLGIPFLYVQVPCKPGADKSLLPVGVESFAEENADDMVKFLEENSVATLDLRVNMSSTREQLEKYFYFTDHHWNTHGGFFAAQQVAERIQTIFPKRVNDMNCLREDQWNIDVYEDWFLGSRGKRVGKFYGGVDDLVIYTPKFETDMSCAINKHRILYVGDFIDANMRLQYLNNGPDYFKDNAYCTYIGGDYPLVQHRNRTAPNNLKILMIKDSFMLPVQAFLSTMFSQIDVVDPRYLTECTVAEYVDMTKPDIVILMCNPSILGNPKFFDYSVKDITEYKNKIVTEHVIVDACTIEVPPRDVAYNYDVVESELKTGTRYSVSFRDVDFTDGSAMGVVTALYNATTKEVICSCPFDLEYYRKAGGFTWTFCTPDNGSGNLQLLLYAGIPGKCNGIGVKYFDVTLIEEKVR